MVVTIAACLVYFDPQHNALQGVAAAVSISSLLVSQIGLESMSVDEWNRLSFAESGVRIFSTGGYRPFQPSLLLAHVLLLPEEKVLCHFAFFRGLTYFCVAFIFVLYDYGVFKLQQFDIFLRIFSS